MDLEKVKELLNGFELSSLLPDLGTILGKLELAMRILIMAGPLVMIVMGLVYYFAAPQEANHHFGYRFRYGMKSEKVWAYTQKVAGIVWTVLGLILTVAMLIVSNGFAGKDAMDMVASAVGALLWQAGLILAASFAIRTIVKFRFDRNGEYRNVK